MLAKIILVMMWFLAFCLGMGMIISGSLILQKEKEGTQTRDGKSNLGLGFFALAMSFVLLYMIFMA